MKVHPNYLFFGPPGSGKTTHGRILAALLNPSLQFVDMSRVCKLASAFVPSFANLYAEHSAKGELVPDDDILPHFRTYMKTVDPKDGISGSGLFRTPEQVRFAFEEIPYFVESCAPIVAVRIRLSPDDAVKNCRARAEDDIAHHRTPRKTDLEDDTNRRRVEIYEQQVEPVLEELRNQCGGVQIVEVPFTGTVHETFIGLAKLVNATASLHLKLAA